MSADKYRSRRESSAHRDSSLRARVVTEHTPALHFNPIASLKQKQKLPNQLERIKRPLPLSQQRRSSLFLSCQRSGLRQEAQKQAAPRHHSVKHEMQPVRSRFFSKEREGSSKETKAKGRTPAYPLKGAEALQEWAHLLSAQEKQELQGLGDVWYLGQRCERGKKGAKDDKEGNFRGEQGDQVWFRYELGKELGSGSFGRVVKVFDHREQEWAALKVVRSQKKCSRQARVEQEILTHIAEEGEQHNVVVVRDHFLWRGHVCFVFELMSLNLYEVIRLNGHQALPDDVVRRFAVQLLQGLAFLGRQGIIHCDIKPENVLLRQSGRAGLRIIDFGSSCFVSNIVHNYIQSRYYRAPEVVLGYPYSLEIDMWSLSLLLAELHTGQPIFPGANQTEQVFLFTEVLGCPPREFVAASERGNWYFDAQGLRVRDRKGKVRKPGSRPLKKILAAADPDFVNFIKRGLEWVPQRRLRPLEGLEHRWILKGMPEEAVAQQRAQLQLQRKVFASQTAQYYVRRK